MPITTGSVPKGLAMDDDDGGVQQAAYHPGNTMAFPTPIPPPEPQPSTVPAQKLRDAVGGLFWMKPSQQTPKR